MDLTKFWEFTKPEWCLEKSQFKGMSGKKKWWFLQAQGDPILQELFCASVVNPVSPLQYICLVNSKSALRMPEDAVTGINFYFIQRKKRREKALEKSTIVERIKKSRITLNIAYYLERNRTKELFCHSHETTFVSPQQILFFPYLSHQHQWPSG